MRPFARILSFIVALIGLAMIVCVAFRLDERYLSMQIVQFFPLSGALIGGLLCLFAGLAPKPRAGDPEHEEGDPEPLRPSERLGWTLIGLALLLWGAAAAWQLLLAPAARPGSPSPADIGYAALPALLLLGLLALPTSGSRRERAYTALDTFIALTAILGLAWSLSPPGALLHQPLSSDQRTWLSLFYPSADLVL